VLRSNVPFAAPFYFPTPSLFPSFFPQKEPNRSSNWCPCPPWGRTAPTGSFRPAEVESAHRKGAVATMDRVLPS
jgi:hypothetical protein